MSPMQWPFAPPSPLTHQKLLLPCASVCELPQITCMQNNVLLEWFRRWHYMCNLFNLLSKACNIFNLLSNWSHRDHGDHVCALSKLKSRRR
jgi:hypothetical protein